MLLHPVAGRVMIGEPSGINPIMPNDTGPPVLIPEGGLTLSPAIFQAAFILLAPLVAGAALLLPLIIGAYLLSGLALFIIRKYFPDQNVQRLDVSNLQQSIDQFLSHENQQ